MWNTIDWVAVAGGLVALLGAAGSALAAVYARGQASSAKIQADAAVEANRLAREAMNDERELRRHDLKVVARLGPMDGSGVVKLSVRIKNNREKDTKIESVAAVFDDGKEIPWVRFLDSFACGNKLEGGETVECYFKEKEQRLLPGSGSHIDWPTNLLAEHWRRLDRIEVRTPFGTFPAEAGEWLDQVRNFKG